MVEVGDVPYVNSQNRYIAFQVQVRKGFKQI